MVTPTNYIHHTMLTASERLVGFSSELRTILAGKDAALSLDDALFVLRQIMGMAESLASTVELEKTRELLEKPAAVIPSLGYVTKRR